MIPRRGARSAGPLGPNRTKQAVSRVGNLRTRNVTGQAGFIRYALSAAFPANAEPPSTSQVASYSATTGRGLSSFSDRPSGERSLALRGGRDPLLSHCDSRSR